MSPAAIRFIVAALLALTLPLSGCCGGGKGKNAAMVQCRNQANDNNSCKACCTSAGARSGFHSKSMGCECTP